MTQSFIKRKKLLGIHSVIFFSRTCCLSNSLAYFAKLCNKQVSGLSFHLENWRKLPLFSRTIVFALDWSLQGPNKLQILNSKGKEIWSKLFGLLRARISLLFYEKQFTLRTNSSSIQKAPNVVLMNSAYARFMLRFYLLNAKITNLTLSGSKYFI